MIVDIVLTVGAVLCAFLAVRARHLLASALWLAGVSALASMLMYRLGAHEIAVIELSVGAGLVTVLFVFAVSIAGEDAMSARAMIPQALSGALVVGALALLGWLTLPAAEALPSSPETESFAVMLWEQRGLDVLVQVGLIFAGTMGVLGLLASEKTAVAHPQSESDPEMPIPKPGELIPTSAQLSSANGGGEQRVKEAHA